MTLEMVLVPIMFVLALIILITVIIECRKIANYSESEIPKMVLYLTLVLFGVVAILYLYLER